MQFYVANFDVGTLVELTMLRDGQRLTVEARTALWE